NYALHRSDGDVLIDAYLGEDGDRQDPYASPLYAGNFSGLPPARILSAEFDMLRDDGGEYAQRLREAGVPVEFTLEPGHVHNSASFTKIMPAARAWRESAVAALRAFFWSTEPRPSGGEEFQELEDELNFTTSAALQQEL
ncbi:alpha/beta hydrolase fold domain-containing protein, partial [Paenarthrobacter sp. RAF9]